MKALLAAAGAATVTLMNFATAIAQDAGPQPGEDVPIDGALGFRDAATPIAYEVQNFHDYLLLPVMVGISVFVLALLVWIVVRYNKKANPVPAKFSHNTMIEVVWTLIPILILIVIALPSFELLYNEDRMPDGQVTEYEAGTRAAAVPVGNFVGSRGIKKLSHLEVALVDQASGEKTMLTADDFSVDNWGSDELEVTLNSPVPEGSLLRVIAGRSRIGKPLLDVFGEDKSQIIPAPSVTIKATGFQWGWTYSYPDYGDFEFDALIAPRDSVPNHLYRLATTNDIVVPAGETIRIVTTARDVIHAWAMPAFAVKIDAVPGRLNETWFYTEREGTYYGQCSEICGIDHAFMPISLKVVSREEFEAWVNQRRDDEGLEPVFAMNTSSAVPVAAELN